MKASWTATVGVALALAAPACLERGRDRPADAGVAPASPGEDGAAPSISRAEPRGEPDPRATVRVRLEAEPSHLNPMITGDGLAVRITLGDVYEGLLCRDEPMARPAACLAVSHEVTPDGREWRFELRRGVRFHDGSALGAADVRRSIEVVARAEIATPLTAELDDLVGVDVERNTVIVRFSGRRLDREGAFARLPILPASALDGDLSLLPALAIHRQPVGTGPLRFSRWRPGESIELVRWDGYWGRPSGAAVIRYLIVGSRERAYAMARNGKLDVATQLPVGEALEVAALSRTIDAYTYARPAYLAAVFNTRRDLARTSSRRRALTMVLDRKAIIDAILAGRGAPISGPFIGEEADPSVEPLPFSPARAAALATGLEGSILYPVESRTMARIADIWAADARDVARLKVVPAPFATVLERARSGEFDIVLLAFTSGRELDMFSRLHSSQTGGENYGGVADVELDRLLEDVRNADSKDARIESTHRLHQRIASVAPYAFIASDVRAGLAVSTVGGLDRGAGLAARFLFKVSPVGAR